MAGIPGWRARSGQAGLVAGCGRAERRCADPRSTGPGRACQCWRVVASRRHTHSRSPWIVVTTTPWALAHRHHGHPHWPGHQLMPYNLPMARAGWRWRASAVGCAALGLAGLVGLVGIVLLIWRVPPALYAYVPDPKDRAAAEASTRTGLIAGLAGLGALGSLAIATRTYRLTQQGQITDRYTKAIEQLGSDKLDRPARRGRSVRRPPRGSRPDRRRTRRGGPTESQRSHAGAAGYRPWQCEHSAPRWAATAGQLGG
jgi:hypothetical protein